MPIVKMKKHDKVDFEKNLYVLKQGRFIFILTEPNHNQFVFICFTQTDYAIGNRTDGAPMLVGRYNSAQEAIDKLADNYEIYQFDNWEVYFNWLISMLRVEI